MKSSSTSLPDIVGLALRVSLRTVIATLLCGFSGVGSAQAKELLWGDTHLHSSYSFDAFLNNNLTADPAVAYRFAMGQPVVHPYHGARVQLERPLDFLAVSDHAEFMGVIRHLYENGPDPEDLEELGFLDRIFAQIGNSVMRDKIDRRLGRDLFAPSLPVPQDSAVEATAELVAGSGLPQGRLTGLLPRGSRIEIDTWASITDVADQYYRPGEFTTLVAWEWSSSPGGANLHRIVLSDASGEQAKQFQPFGFDDSPYPDQLWAYLRETTEATGVSFVAIPHNSNISKGAMFDNQTLRGEPMDVEYIATRRHWEPIAEVSQIKGDSETHPALSPDDEFADFETYPYYIQRDLQDYRPGQGDYLRSALRRGLELESQLGINPFQLGMIGSTDAHTGLSSADENNFHGKMATDSIPANKDLGFGNPGGTSGWAMSASGLAAVWATENTREAIIEAMRRREVYATSGPRIALRFHGAMGWDLPGDATPSELEDALATTVPMGGELGAAEGVPTFFVEALHDPLSGTLDRIQIIKGWLDADGRSKERVFNVALSDESRRGANGVIEPVADSVDRGTGKAEFSTGAAQLTAVWKDPEFVAGQSAFYYARVLQIPTARHSLLDAIALGAEHARAQPDTIQERAYSSPIWYRPSK